MLDQLSLGSCCCRMRVTTAVSILGWMGIIISVLVILADILAAGMDFSLLSEYASALMVIVYVFIVVMIIIFLILLIMNTILINRNSARSFSGVKSIIKIICKFNLSIQMIASILIISGSLVQITVTGKLLSASLPDQNLVSSLSLPSVICVVGIVWMIFLSLAIHGIRKKRKSLIKAYIMFNMVFVILEIVYFFREISFEIIGGVLAIVGYIHQIGYFVVLYNIMDISLDNGHEMNAVEHGRD